MFACPGCGQVHEPSDGEMKPFPASTVAVTTELAVSGPIRYLAVWRLLPKAMAAEDPVWEYIRRAAAPGPAHVYVPAFSMVRPVVQRLGVRLTETQPVLQLEPGAPPGQGPHAVLLEAPFGSPATLVTEPASNAPEFQTVSPIVIGRREAWGLAHFIYLAIEARETRDLLAADMHLEPGEEELLFFPAVWDPRYIHESNWRLLLREFDGLVA